MDIENFDLEKIGKTELEKINGGGFVVGTIGAVCAVAGLALAGAAALGYADGKGDCMPPPCR